MFNRKNKGFSLIEILLIISVSITLLASTFAIYSKVSSELEISEKKSLLDDIIQATIEATESHNIHNIDLNHFGLSSIKYYLSDDTKKKLWGANYQELSEDDFNGSVLLKTGDLIDVVYNCNDEKECYATVGISAYTISKSDQTRNCIAIINHYKTVYPVSLSGPAGVLKLDPVPQAKEISDWCDYGWAYGYSIAPSRLPDAN